MIRFGKSVFVHCFVAGFEIEVCKRILNDIFYQRKAVLSEGDITKLTLTDCCKCLCWNYSLCLVKTFHR